MSLVIPPGFGLASIVLNGVDGTQPYVTTIGVGTTDAGGDYVGVANKVFNAYVTAFQSLTNNDLVISKVTLLVGSDGGNGSVDSDVPAQQGLRSVEMAPTAMSLIARKQTASLGRTGRGRMFIPGVLGDGDVTASGAIEEASAPIFAEACEDFRNFLATLPGDTNPAAPAYLLHNEGSPTTSPSAITALRPAPLVGWIRGRIR